MKLTARQFDLLEFIAGHEPCAQWQVGEGCGISMETAWGWCVTLKVRGVITYRETVYQSVMLTDEGRTALDKHSNA